jgi:D-arabinose 1-dehydrogenase-like Zn-dependent alcohol dehydrogenase
VLWAAIVVIGGRIRENVEENRSSGNNMKAAYYESFRGLADQGRLSAGEWVAVHGCGGVGLSAI